MVEVRVASTRHRLLPEAMPRIGPAQLGAIEMLAGAPAAKGDRRVFFALRIDDRAALVLERMGVEFVGADGHVHLRAPGLFVRVAPQRPKPLRAPRSRCSASDLRLLHVLLRDGGTAGRTHRMLADDAGIALGAVGAGLRNLESMQLLERLATTEFDVVDVDRAQAAFAEGWASCLRRKLRPVRFRLAKASETTAAIRLLRPFHDAVLLGGELAAARTTGLFRTESTTLHVNPSARNEIVRALGLLPDDHGPIHVLDRFGRRDGVDDPISADSLLAHPLLVHAELARLVDERVVEARAAVWNAWKEREHARRTRAGHGSSDPRSSS